jgi:hypothetical protein
MVAVGVLAAVVATLALGATGSHSGTGRGPGSLRIVESVTLRSFTFSLHCNPAGGTAPDPQRICDAIRANPALLHSLPGADHSCPSGAPDESLTGTWEGRPLRAHFSVCTAGQEQLAADWAQLLGGDHG